MKARFSRYLLATTACISAGAACQDKEADGGPAGRVSIGVSPLTLDGVGNARWRLTVENGASPRQTVWTAELDADRYGDGRGAVSYVGTCDASPGNETHTISLELLDLYDEGGARLAPDTYQNPTVPTPISVTAICRENADVPVNFDVVVMRSALQGFFDVAVEFDNVFCSAKMDCSSELLNYPEDDPQGREGRGPTAIVAFACTAGSDAAGQERPTYLYLNEVKVSCPRAAPADPEVVWVHPTGGPGNLGARPPLLYETALYYGHEGFANLNKCFWNLALGVELAEITNGPCRVEVQGTASSTRLVNHQVGADQRWPVVSWDVSLDVVGGALECGVNPLDGDGSGVSTSYVGPESEAFFTYELECRKNPPPPVPYQTCVVPFEGKSFAFGQGISGINVRWGDVQAPMPYTLPNPGWRLSQSELNAGCCSDGCCQ